MDLVEDKKRSGDVSVNTAKRVCLVSCYAQETYISVDFF